MRRAHLIAGLAVLVLAGCSGGRDGALRDLRSFDRSPEEFGILPAKPLEIPATLNALPDPTPGAANRTDPTPRADAVAVLGGNPAALSPGTGIGAGDAALVNATGRFGRQEGIRTTLRAEDAEFRRSRSRFTWSIVPRDDYNRAYERQMLDPYRWLDRYRAAGAQTPAAPPE